MLGSVFELGCGGLRSRMEVLVEEGRIEDL